LLVDSGKCCSQFGSRQFKLLHDCSVKVIKASGVLKYSLVATIADTGDDLAHRLLDSGIGAVSNTPEQFATYIRAETTKWAKVIKDANIRIE
jgi:hypothetical protein